MKNMRQAMMLTGAAVLLFAPLALATPDDAQFKCEQSVDKAGAKFVGAKSKCIQKCLANFWKGAGPSGDCFPPYAGPTAQCINDTVLGLKGAENKFSAAIKKACDPATKAGTECPTCYNSGDCSQSGYAGDQVQNIEGQVDSFVPGVACELGADPGEQKCMTNTAKALSKQVAGVVKCYDKCQTNAHKGLINVSACAPPASDPATSTCISGVDGKAIASVNKLCGDVGAIPDCSSTDDYPDGASWVNLVDIAISGNQPNTYCQ
jgi:hypothetical protein